MKRPFLHSSGMTGRMAYEPRFNEAVIWIEHCGERAEAIIDHPVTMAIAKQACELRDIDTYIQIFRMAA